MAQSEAFYNPKAKQAVLGGILLKLTSHDEKIDSLDTKVDTMQAGLLEIRGWLKALVAVWAVVLLTGSIFGWLVSNEYIVFQNPKTPSVVQAVNATIK